LQPNAVLPRQRAGGLVADEKRGPGRPPGSGSGIRPELRERADADLVAYCKQQQALSPGFLARLVEQHRVLGLPPDETPYDAGFEDGKAAVEEEEDFL